jgi:hypothetical protein
MQGGDVVGDLIEIIIKTINFIVGFFSLILGQDSTLAWLQWNLRQSWDPPNNKQDEGHDQNRSS